MAKEQSVRIPTSVKGRLRKIPISQEALDRIKFELGYLEGSRYAQMSDEPVPQNNSEPAYQRGWTKGFTDYISGIFDDER